MVRVVGGEGERLVWESVCRLQGLQLATSTALETRTLEGDEWLETEVQKVTYLKLRRPPTLSGQCPHHLTQGNLRTRVEQSLHDLCSGGPPYWPLVQGS